MSREFEDKSGEPAPTLAVALKPTQARGTRIGTTLFLSFVMTAIAIAIPYFYFAFPESEDTSWFVATIVIFGFGVVALLALLLLWSTIRQAMALSVPMTIVEVDKQPVAPGDSLVVCVKQPGPLRLRSLRLNVLGSLQTIRNDPRVGEIGQRRSPTKTILQENILDAGSAVIPSGGYRQWTCTFQVPADAAPSGKANAVTTTWILELWGVARSGLIGFHYQFPIRIVVPE